LTVTYERKILNNRLGLQYLQFYMTWFISSSNKIFCFLNWKTCQQECLWQKYLYRK